MLGLLVLCGCPATHPPSEGCGKDTDCKGDRICTEGACVPAPPTDEPVAARDEAPAPKPSAGQDETWFRGGPGHAGASAAVGPTSEPAPAWVAELGAVVFATPTLAEGPKGLTAYVGTHAGRFVGVVVAGDRAGELGLDLDLGGRIWATAAARGAGEELRLYVGNDDDTLFALAPAADGADNQIAWRKRLGNCENTRSPGPEGARCDVDGGPTLAPNGDLLVGADGVYRLSAEGEIRWHWPSAEQEERPKHVFSTPVLTADGRVYFGGQDGFVTALSAETGEQQWQYTVRADVDGSGVIGPDGALFIGADDGRIYALRSDGSLRWSFVVQRDIRSSLGIAPDGTVYATSFDGNLYSLAPSGEVNWVLPTGGVIHSSPVVDADGTVFFGSQDDHLYAVSPAGKVLWAIDVGADVDSSVALTDDGAVIVGCDDGTLRAFVAAVAE
ncbi:Serine/threonine-protein kinase AfsK [Enhygromyxa salina]|uniref:Serine/threonine-protein kinase AfsK n=1 Tax=Enhygromyxa salina TaxID=215803 RepID=A0A2S9YEQ6_9BACT|nr:PQQ-binding-like beta-propeller repeat protein [Enhygromyxa salina]PRQ03598.1 Serine/threonine-protein kinase AfsK [Enhygromyxa salina]